jgi:hypothetical protein
VGDRHCRRDGSPRPVVGSDGEPGVLGRYFATSRPRNMCSSTTRRSCEPAPLLGR